MACHCSGAKRRSISRLATAASASDADLGVEEEHDRIQDGASQAAAAVSADLDMSHLVVCQLCRLVHAKYTSDIPCLHQLSCEAFA